eukprot:Nitzschia sp. Nitz4//scaffold133_size116822//48575//50092//NITZ4_003803-RA/size116822-snap-gene-0.14-mRNA-1//-1//CDS//3329535384//8272//frame0
MKQFRSMRGSSFVFGWLWLSLLAWCQPSQAFLSVATLPFSTTASLASPGPTAPSTSTTLPTASTVVMSPKRITTTILFMSSDNADVDDKEEWDTNWNKRDLYQCLGISKDASDREIKKGFRQMAQKYHPDASQGGSEEGRERFKDVSFAYEILKDSETRQKYDMFGYGAVAEEVPDGAAGGDPFGGANPFGGGNPFGQEVDLGDLFGSFFGGGMGGGAGAAAAARRQGPIPGDDLRYDLTIDFKTGVFGGEEKVTIRHDENCKACGGDGVAPGSSKKKCTACNGAGVTVQVAQTPLGHIQTQQACSKCKGTGEVIEKHCHTCKGKGVVATKKQIKVNIPPGVEDGNKLRVRGEGDAGSNGGPPGDLYIFLKVKEHPKFRREGPEIYSEESISYLDALLGSQLKTPTVDGEVTIKIPPGTQPGQVMRLRNNGAPKLGNAKQRGDHYVTIKVDIPKRLSPKETELIQQLRDLRDNPEKKKGLFS